MKLLDRTLGDILLTPIAWLILKLLGKDPTKDEK